MITPTFVVTPGNMAVLGLTGADQEDKFVLQRQMCVSCEEASWEDILADGEFTTIEHDNNVLTVTLPGTYRLRHVDEPSCTCNVCFEIFSTCCGGK